MEDKLFKTGAVMDLVSNAKVEKDVDSLADAAVKNKVFQMPHVTRTIVREYKKINRNDKCPCGSGNKYKKCCLESKKYEHYHELTRIESSKVKAHDIQLSSFIKDPLEQ